MFLVQLLFFVVFEDRSRVGLDVVQVYVQVVTEPQPPFVFDVLIVQSVFDSIVYQVE